MDLTQLQIELRNIENHLSLLHSEIENMKPQTDKQKYTYFETITKLANQYPIDGIKITKASEVLKKEFINSLSYLLLTEDTDIYVRLLYLSRLAVGCKIEETAEDIYKSGLDFDNKDIEKICIDLQQYKYSYLIEALIMANFSKEAPINMLTLVADMAKIMGCDKEEICVLVQIAKSRLLDDWDILKNIPVPSKNRWSGKFSDYIPNEWIISQRIECATICTEKMNLIRRLAFNTKRDVCIIKEQLQSESIVKFGDPILVYEEKVKKESTPGASEQETVKETKTVKSPKDGIVFYAEKEEKGNAAEQGDKYLTVYVVSFFDEYNDFRKWYAEKNK